MRHNVPPDWKLVNIEEVTQQFSERNGSKKSDFPVLSVTNSEGFINSNDYFGKQVFSKDLSNYKIVRKNQFAYNPSRINVGSLARLKDWPAGLLSPMYVVFQTLDSIIPEYLEYWLNSGKATTQIKNNTQGTVRDSVSYATLQKFLISIPPLPEQKKITVILSSVDDAIQTIQAVIDQTRRVKLGLMQQLLKRGIGHTQFKQTEIGEIPEGWELVFIYEMSEKSRNSLTIGPFGSNLIKDDYRNKGVPVVFVRDIKPNQFVRKSNVFVDSEKAIELTAHSVKANDVVITKMGMPPGIAAVYPEKMLDGVITADIIRLRPNRDIVNPHFLSEILNSSIIANQVIRLTAGQTRPKLTLRDYKTIQVPLPPMHEQERIASALVSVSNLCKSEEIKLEQLSIIKRGLMQDLLTGRVCVKLTEEATT